MTTLNQNPQVSRAFDQRECHSRNGSKISYRFARHTQAAVFNPVDALMFGRVATEAPVIESSIRTTANRMSSDLHTATRMEFDAFAALYRHRAEASGNGEPLAKEILARVMASDGFEALHRNTSSDEVASALAATSIVETVAAALSKELKDRAAKEREQREAAEDAKALADVMADDPESSPEQLAEAREAAKEAAAKHAAAAAALRGEIRDRGEEIGKAVARGVSAAGDAASGLKQAGAAFGVGSTDPGAGMNVAARFEIAKVVQRSGPAFRKMLELIGRLTQEALRKAASRTRVDSGEVAEVGLGSDVGRMLDEELAALTDTGDALALGRYADDSMGVLEVDQRETHGKGDLIVLLDESGSMASVVPARVGSENVTREGEAKGVVLALAHAALRQRRRVVVHFFQDTVTKTVEIEPADVGRREGGCPVASRKMAEIASRGCAGGTCFDAPLMTGLASLKRAARADLLMVTDGVAPVAPGTVAAIDAVRKATGLSVFTVLIGGEAGRATEVVRTFSDRVWAVESMLTGTASELMDLV